MRSDAIGLFWQDMPRKKGERAARVMPPIPDTGWQRPTEFPRLGAASALAIDVETWDPHLVDDGKKKAKGPGWARHDGHLVGIAVGVPDGPRWYFPMRHEVESDWNLDPEHVLAWARNELTRPEQPKIGANIGYDVGWLREEGVHVKGELHDVQFAEALLAEASPVNLDHLGMKYLDIPKQGETLYEWCSNYYGGPVSERQRKNIYRAPPRLVGPYAEGDVHLPLHVIGHQWQRLHEQGLLGVYTMECRLIYLMIEMRFAGVRVDLDRADQLRTFLTNEIDDIDRQIRNMVGFEVNTSANASMAHGPTTLNTMSA